jgi:hypothetical protein
MLLCVANVHCLRAYRCLTPLLQFPYAYMYVNMNMIFIKTNIIFTQTEQVKEEYWCHVVRR